MAKKQNWYYVLVMTDGGAVFVTDVDRRNKEAHWVKTDKPLAMSKEWAEDLTLGLNLNWHLAFTVCSKFELDNQPYLYNIGEFKWVMKDRQEDEDGDKIDKEDIA